MTSSVIKAGAAGARATNFNFDDMSRQAEAYIAKVRAESSKIVAEARADADRRRHDAEEQGRRAAVVAAENSVEQRIAKQMETLLPALRGVVEKIDASRHQWLAHWEKSAVHLAASIASRVLRRKIETHGEASVALIREALELAVGSRTIKIRLSATDFAALGSQATVLAKELARMAQTEVVADDSLEPGGCIVETEFGEIDQTFAAQLQRIEEELC